jgi:hypothetical protein
LKKVERVEDLGLYFVVQYKIDDKLVSDELIENGSEILVMSSTLDNYIQKRIEHLQQKDKIFIHEIKSGIYSVTLI